MKNHSGGAKGYDTLWDLIGKQYGVVTNHYTTSYYDKLENNEKIELNIQYVEVANFLKRGILDANTYAGKLVRRDMIQANKADAIFGVTELVKPGVIGRKGFKNRCSFSVPEGGTAYATIRGILSNKPTYIFNPTNHFGNDIGWYIWDFDKKDFLKCEEPVLTENFAGIGSQITTELGENAIKSIFNKL